MSVFYSDNSVTLYHGDCREILPQLDMVDHVITDPPYDDQTHSRGGSVIRYDGGPDIAKIPFAALNDVAPVAQEFARVTRRWMLIFCAVRQVHGWSTALEAAGVRVPRVMVWVKPDASPQFSGDRPGHGYESIVVAHPVGRTRWNGGGKKGVYEHLRMDRASGFWHPTQKPEKLLAELVADFTDIGDTVLDPFAGSGTTLVAAKRLGRKAIGVEVNEQYAEMVANRLRQSALDLWAPAPEIARSTDLFDDGSAA